MAAITYPIALADFFTDLGTVSVSFDLSDALETNENGGGEIFTSAYGPRLWYGDIEVRPHPHVEMDAVMVEIDALFEADASFFVSIGDREGTIADLDGSAYGAATPAIAGFNGSTMRELDLSGLPANYVISKGDYLSFEYSSSPTRYAFHRVTSGGTANGSGALNGIDVQPRLRTGIATSDPVSMAPAFLKAKAIPGSKLPPRRNAVISTGPSFSWRQTLR